MEYSSSSSSSSSDSDDEEETLEDLTLAVTTLVGATQAIVAHIARITEAEDAECMELDASSDEEATTPGWGGSTPGRKKVDRDFEGAYINLVKMYFSGVDSVYTSTKVFETRFGMPRVVFN
jgi:flavodoxin